MTTRKKAGTKTKGSKRLAMTKRTLKDLSVSGGPKAGFIMQDTVIIRTGGRHG
jgi:hypothetical protein